MRWWSRFWRRGSALVPPEATRQVRLRLPGWQEGPSDGELRLWHDSDGDVLSLAVPVEPIGPQDPTDDGALRRWCRQLAENRGAGLIEARRIPGQTKPAVQLIYKRLQIPAYIYTGMLITSSAEERCLVWTIVACERGITGLREAIITDELTRAGELTVEDYVRCWAQDPYDATYDGVDRGVLCFISDDESYDEQFPQHPLSKVRRVLAALPHRVEFAPSSPVW